ncbi:DMT family transporter [Novosphingobium album (ex Hu et al. 2023)]|uniref:DMT family transporter n=1 Tax=Novosphingobium album (ex Hu et al. 2023) TaxID=2930093 RepID=A0ABT0B740_9SPHN|nr:DMT family transporter [Novosphingobium album (ex Hu et al. 2023)]MCJ2180629.1 DMT family transporter [Novosphingobium album (ex Hu et al. 2023)]
MRAQTFPPSSPWLPVLSVVAGIGTFSAMDAAIKGASIATGVFTALLLRNVFGTVLTVPLWLAVGCPLPSRAVLKVHATRSAMTAAMATLFFYGLVRIPLAEGIAISFIAPIVALYFASVMLGEKIRPQAITASLLGVIGVVVIGWGRFGSGTYSPDAIRGTVAILCSAMFYAVNLVYQRKQALLAGPVEIALFQNGIVALIFLCFSPWFAVWPDAMSLRVILLGAALATSALLFLSWGYARAEAQVLVPVEYTGFLWAALFGWLFFGESVEPATLAGAMLIVLGCWIATKKQRNRTIV